MKRTGMPPRRSRLSPGGGPTRKAKLNPVNRKRRTTEFARTYHSRERVALIRAMRCACGCGRTPCDNAHVGGNGGMGRKGHYTEIVPLHRPCHRAFDEWRPPFNDPLRRQAIGRLAQVTEDIWQDHLNAQGRAA